MKRPIITDFSKLRERANEINIKENAEEVSKVLVNLRDTVIKNNLVGLSAPQIGKNLRIIAMNFNGDIRLFINPMITKFDGIHASIEKDPSLPNREFIVPRYDRVLVTYQTPIGRPETNQFEGVASEVVQQLIQTLDCIYLDDLGLEIFDDFKQASKEEQDEVINYYMNHLKEQLEEVNKDIASNEELAKTNKAIEFMTKVQTGEIKQEAPKIPMNREQRRTMNKLAKKLAKKKVSN